MRRKQKPQVKRRTRKKQGEFKTPKKNRKPIYFNFIVWLEDLDR